MANLIRSAKSGNDWTQNELRAYNIQVVDQSFVEFFNQNQAYCPLSHPPSVISVRAKSEDSLPTMLLTRYCTTLISYKTPRNLKAWKPLSKTWHSSCWRCWGTRQVAESSSLVMTCR